MKKQNKQLRKQWNTPLFWGIMLLMIWLPEMAFTQGVPICGTYTRVQPPLTGAETGEYLYDRFGNKYDRSEDIVKHDASAANCAATGYFNLNYGGGFTSDEEATICAVFSYLAGQIANPTGTPINISISKALMTNPNVLATGTALYEEENECNTRANVVWNKMYTGYGGNVGNVDGIMKFNTSFNNLWHTLQEDDPNNGFTDFDLYSVTLHEALHIMGFASRIHELGLDGLNFYSEWDKHLYAQHENEFLILDTPTAECCSQKSFNSGVFTKMPDDLITECNGPGVISFGADNLAEVNAFYPDGGSLGNYLSHLCDNSLVMFGSLLPGDDSKRQISATELAILCRLGYDATGCNSDCMLQANQDFFTAQGQSYTINYTELLANDAFPANGNLQIVSSCGDWDNVNVTSNSNSLTVTNLPSGFTTLCYELSGCNGACATGEIIIFHTGTAPDCTDNPNPLELMPLGTFESFTSETFANYQNFSANTSVSVNGHGTADLFSNCSNDWQIYSAMCDNPPVTANGDWVCVNPSSTGSNFVMTGSTPSHLEAFYLPLCEELEPGCEYILSMWILSGCTNSLNIAFSEDIPCPFNVGPGIGPVLHDGAPSVTCNTDPSYDYSTPLTLNIPFINTDNTGDGAPNWSLYSVNFMATEALDIATFYPTPAFTNPTFRTLYLDDISLTKAPETQLDVTSNVTNNCIGGDAVIQYTICSDQLVTLDLSATLTSVQGVSYSNQGNFTNGQTTITIDPAINSCQSLELILDVDISVDSGTSFAVILTGDATQGCGEVFDVQQVVLDQSNEPGFPGFIYDIDCAEVEFFSITGGADHFWDFGDQNGTSQLPNPIYTYTASGTYTVVHSIRNACGVSEVEMEIVIDLDNCNVDICACSNGINIMAGEGTHSDEISNLPTSLQGGCISISGTLIISGENTWSGTEVIMSPGAQIVIGTDPNYSGDDRLNLENLTTIHGCSEMWKGIVVHTGAKLDMENSEIRDAEHAINAKNESRIHLFHNTFNANYIGIFTEKTDEAKFFKSFEDDPWSENTFESTYTLLPKYPGQYPDPEGISKAAIEFNDVHDILLFESGFPNYIRDSKWGVIIDHGLTVDLNGLEISELYLEYSPIGNFGNFGIGIELTDCDVIEVKDTRIGNCVDWPVNGNCTPLVRIGVLGTNSELEFENNQVGSLLIAVWLTDGINKDVEVSNNQEIISSQFIQVDHYTNDNGKEININDNTQVYVRTNITLWEVHNGVVNVDDNISTHWRAYTEFYAASGIWSASSDGEITISGNIMNAPFIPNEPNGGVGIDIQNSQNCLVEDNVINGTGLETHFTGIRVNNSQNNVYCCNSIHGAKRGVFFGGSCTGTVFRNTEFNDHHIGLYLYNAELDPQLEHGNDWSNANTTYANALFTSEDPANAALSFFYTHPSLVPNLQTKFFVTGGTYDLWFDADGNADDSSCGNTCGADDPWALYGSPPTTLTPIDIRAAQDPSALTAIAKGLKWNAQEALYRKLSYFPHLINLDQDVNQFYTAASRNLIDEFFDIREGIKNVGQLGISGTNYWQLKDAIAINIQKLIDLQIEFDRSPPAIQPGVQVQIDQTIDQQGNLFDDLRAIEQNLKTLQSNAINNLIFDNNQLIVNEVYEQNEKVVNDIFLNTVGKGIYTFSESQKGLLRGISEQCPYVGGSSVLRARSLRGIYEKVLYDDDLNCGNIQLKLAEEEAETSAVNAQVEIKVFPNPADSEINILCNIDLENDHSLMIHSMDGKMVLSEKLTSAMKSFKVNTSQLGEGFYVYRIFDNNFDQVASDKFVIIR